MTNRTSTAKYTFWNFVPKNLFEQFRRLANIYFLAVGLIQATTNLSPTARWNTLGPLIFVIFVNAVRELFEDVKRHRSDHLDNSRIARVLHGAQLMDTYWALVRVGDIVAVDDGEEFPADCVLLACEVADGVDGQDCFVETANLDGESNLKQRYAVTVNDPATGSPEPRPLRGAELDALRLRVGFEPPSNKLYSMTGTVSLCDVDGETLGRPQPFSISNVLLRGTTLRNTRRVFGLVLYVGQDLRSVRNSVATPSKRSNVEKRIDHSVGLIFVCLLVICVVSWVLAGMQDALNPGHWYLGKQEPSQSWALLVSFLILFNNLVPISLYVTVELVKFTMSRYVEDDRKMYAPATDQPATSRTSNLHEDLGQIKYVFTDKTGTLTMNKMVFSRCSVDGVIYGAPPEEGHGDDRGNHAAIASQKSAWRSSASTLDEESLFDPALLRRDFRAGDDRAKRIDEFMTIICTCHSALPVRGARSGTEGSEAGCDSIGQGHQDAGIVDGGIEQGLAGTSQGPPLLKGVVADGAPSGGSSGGSDGIGGCDDRGSLKFKAASPDEGALLAGAALAGWACVDSRRSAITVNAQGEERRYDVLAVNAFSPTRKRMSVLLRERKTGRYMVCCKGADDVMLEHVIGEGEGPAAAVGSLATDAEDFASQHSLSLSRSLPSARSQHSAARALTPQSCATRQPPLSLSSIAGGGQVTRRNTAGRNEHGWGGGSGVGAATRLSTLRAETLNHLHDFATRGLRTLIFAIAYPEEDVAQAWLARWRAASVVGDKHEEAVEAAAAELEVGLRLVGASAIEDRLQAGVPQTISALQEGGMHVWMLTGDKLETAINVATAAHLISLATPLLVISSPKSDPAEQALLAASTPGLSFAQVLASRILARLNELEQYLRNERSRGRACGLAIDGRSLSIVLESESLQRKFIRMAQQCSAVVVCRVSPLQKALAIRLVKEHVLPTPLTLAVGDGANDVSMIQEADVGVGIYGVEGTQATRASDYAVAQFRFLSLLLLIHGRTNYRRVSLTFLYSFYKNITMVVTLFLFGADTAFSGSSLYDGYLMSAFNVFFTFLPIIAYAIQEADLSPSVIARYPQLYRDGQENSQMNAGRMLMWLFDSVRHAVIVYFLSSACLGAYAGDALGLDHGVRGAAINAALVVSVSAKLWLQTSHWTMISVIFYALSIIAWFSIAALYATVGIYFNLTEFHFVGVRAQGVTAFWCTLVVVPVTAVAADAAVAYLSANYTPTVRQVLMEIDRGYGMLPGRGGGGVTSAPGVPEQWRHVTLSWRGVSLECIVACLRSVWKGHERPSTPGSDASDSRRRPSTAGFRGKAEKGLAPCDDPGGDEGGFNGVPQSADDAGARTLDAYHEAMGSRFSERWTRLQTSLSLATASARMHWSRGSSAGAGEGARGAMSAEALLQKREQLAFEDSIEKVLREEQSGATHSSPHLSGAGNCAGAVRALAASCTASSGRVAAAFRRHPRVSPGGIAGGNTGADAAKLHSTSCSSAIGSLGGVSGGGRSGGSPGARAHHQRMHSIWLFFDDAEHEAAFLASFTARNYTLQIFATMAVMVVLLIHLLVGVLQPLADGGSVDVFFETGTACLIAAFGAYLFLLRRSDWPRRHFEALNIFIYSLLGFGLLVGISDARTLIMLIFPVFAYVVAPVRWARTVPIVALHHPAFILLEWLEKIPLEPLLSFYWLIVCVIGTVVARMLEASDRRDFLLQQRLRETKVKNDSILDNMLPPHVNERRKRGEEVIANVEPSVSVIFCDIQDFKQIVKENSPGDLIRLLDNIYSEMDRVSDRRMVTKMETVGYTYMACAGLAGAHVSQHGHAYDALLMAFELLSVAQSCRTRHGRQIVVRVGINSGPVLSGVVGESKPQYCLFGDTVNTAARMQAKGERMQVHVSESVYKELEANCVLDEFELEARKVNAKGKGWLNTFIVRAKEGTEGGLCRQVMQRAGATLGARSLEPPVTSVSGSGWKLGRLFGGGPSPSPDGKAGRRRMDSFLRGGDEARLSGPGGQRGFRGDGVRSPSDPGPSCGVGCVAGGGGRRSARGGGGGGGGEGGGRGGVGAEMAMRRTSSGLDTDGTRVSAADSQSATARDGAVVASDAERLAEEKALARDINGTDLRFLNDTALLEVVFVRSHALNSLREMRRALSLLAVGQMGFIVMEGVLFLEAGRQNSAYVAMASTAALLTASACTHVVGPVESALRMSAAQERALTRVRRAVVLAYMVYGALVPVTQIAKRDIFGRNSSAVLVCSAALISWSGGTRFLEVAAMSTVWFVVWVLCGMAGGFSADGERMTILADTASAEFYAQEGELAHLREAALHTLIVLIFFTLVAVTYSSYVGEYSKRRLYLLLYRMHKEMVRTDELLHNMMPVSVVSKLKNNVPVADQLEGVLLLYSDIAGFTAMSHATRETPQEVIKMLRYLYTVFDALVVQHNLFKVQTIGDAYIIMSNVDSTARDRDMRSQSALHKAERDARAMLRMAFDMVRTLAEYKAPHGKALRMRIGIHFGTVTAGIIGSKKLRYDIFGTDALLGNALESNGIIGGVCVSEEVVPLLAGLTQYELVPHERVRLEEQGEFIGETNAYHVQVATELALKRLFTREAFQLLASGATERGGAAAAVGAVTVREDEDVEPPVPMDLAQRPGGGTGVGTADTASAVASGATTARLVRDGGAVDSPGTEGGAATRVPTAAGPEALRVKGDYGANPGADGDSTVADGAHADASTGRASPPRSEYSDLRVSVPQDQ